MESVIFPLIVFIYGLLIGSFLNVCIYRMPLGRTVVKGRSYCPSCNSLIPWYLNIPVFSYLFLLGRCKNCKTRISIIYPAVELLNALLYVLAYIAYGLSFQALFLAALFSIVIIIALIYIKCQIIPKGLAITALILGFLFIFSSGF